MKDNTSIAAIAEIVNKYLLSVKIIESKTT